MSSGLYMLLGVLGVLVAMAVIQRLRLQAKFDRLEAAEKALKARRRRGVFELIADVEEDEDQL